MQEENQVFHRLGLSLGIELLRLGSGWGLE